MNVIKQKIRNKTNMIIILLMFVVTLSSLKTVQVKADFRKIGKVLNITATNKTSRSVTIKWKKVKKAKKYKIKYSTNKRLKKSITRTVNKNKIKFRKLKSGTKYFFKVRVISENNIGKWSETKSFMTKKATVNKLDRKKGYFYLNIKGNGKTTNLKIDVQVDRKNTAKEALEVTYSSSGDNNHSVHISETSGKSKIADDGNYNLFSVGFSFKKPAHFGASISTNGSISKDFLVEAPGYFTTVNNQSAYILGGYHSISSDITDGLVKLNATDVGLLDVDGKTNHVTININLKECYGGLKVNPNGGSWKSRNVTYTSETNINWAGKCGTTMTIANPVRVGYKFKGWTTYENSNGSCSYGKITGNVCGEVITSGSSTFTFCGEAASFLDAKTSSKKCYTTLTAMWEKQ